MFAFGRFDVSTIFVTRGFSLVLISAQANLNFLIGFVAVVTFIILLKIKILIFVG